MVHDGNLQYADLYTYLVGNDWVQVRRRTIKTAIEIKQKIRKPKIASINIICCNWDASPVQTPVIYL